MVRIRYFKGANMTDLLSKLEQALDPEGLGRTPVHEALLECVRALERLQELAVAIEIKHPEECAHGAGYSLLGQLAQQVSTDGYYALQALAKELEKS